MIYEHPMAARQFGNRTTMTDDYRCSTAHGFSDGHTKGFRITYLHVDTGALKPMDYLGILDAPDEINASQYPQVGSESVESLIGVAFFSNNDKSLFRKGFENHGDGTQKNFPSLDADDAFVQVEHGRDMQPGAV